MIKYLQNLISEQVGFDNFDAVASVPTGGLVIASSLAFEILKPLVYVRSEAKGHGTGKLVEGFIKKEMKILMVDDVATTGGSVVNGIKALREAGAEISDVYVIVDRLEGASESLKKEGVMLHRLFDILEIAKILHQQGLIDKLILDKVQKQASA
jgi:orotate phosphoribosyltransferase